jgi:hypothetical protein
MKYFLLLPLFLFSFFDANAQYDYKTAVGARAGFSQGITVKHFIGRTSAVEGIVSFRYRGFVATALYEIHANAFDVSHLHWYYGVGGHVGFWDYYDGHPWYDDDDGAKTAIGIDGILGIEYNIQEIPINVSLDWKPAINIIGFSNAIWDGGALSVRYMIP